MNQELQSIKDNGLYKAERVITSPQSSNITVQDGQEVLNLCANNYLGLANHPEIVEAARSSLDAWGYGLASVRFICGTQAIHKQLEDRLSEFLGMEDTILYASCFDANGGLFETLLGPEDAVISDALNHASIIDGIRLCKARRFRYQNNDMQDLEDKLQQASDARFRMIATDGVFSMDGYIADLQTICDLAEKYDALVMVDDSHAVGFMGEHGSGTHEYTGVLDRVDIITGTLGKALGGASGGYTSARKEFPLHDEFKRPNDLNAVGGGRGGTKYYMPWADEVRPLNQALRGEMLPRAGKPPHGNELWSGSGSGTLSGHIYFYREAQIGPYLIGMNSTGAEMYGFGRGRDYKMEVPAGGAVDVATGKKVSAGTITIKPQETKVLKVGKW